MSFLVVLVDITTSCSKVGGSDTNRKNVSFKVHTTDQHSSIQYNTVRQKYKQLDTLQRYEVCQVWSMPDVEYARCEICQV